MKIHSKIVIFTILFLTFLSSHSPAHSLTENFNLLLTEEEKSWLKNHPKIRVSPDPEFYPIEYFDENNNYCGIAADYIRLISQKTGIKFEIIRFPSWKDVIENIQKRNTDMLGSAVITPQRKDYLLFPPYYLEIPTVLITRKGVEKNISLKDLDGLKITVVNGYSYMDHLANMFPKAVIDTAPNIKSALEKVSFGLSDGFVGDLATSSYYIDVSGISNLCVYSEIPPVNNSGFAIRSDWPEFLSIINKASSMVSQEEKQQIIRKWISLSHPDKSNEKMLAMLKLFSAGIFVLLIIIYIWNTNLKKQVIKQTRQLTQELSERQKAEIALFQSREDLRIILNSIREGVISVDKYLNVLQMNPAASSLTGLQLNSDTPLNLSDLFSGNEKIIKNMISIFAGKYDSIHHEVTIRPAGKYEKHLIFSAVPIIKDQLISGAVIVLVDVTENRKLEDQLAHASKMEAIGSLAGGIAHDFNNLLTGIIGSAELLKLSIDAGTESEKYCNDIIKSCSHAGTLTKRLLTFSRKGLVNPISLNLHAIIDEITGILERTIDKRIKIVKKYEAEKPDFVGDASQIHNAVLNICLNARDAMPEGGTLTLKTYNTEFDHTVCQFNKFCVSPGKYSVLKITDSGIGISEDVINKIFQPFFTTKEPGKGTGLGLAAVYGTMQSHGGAVHVHSSPGKGSAFTLYFPLSEKKTVIVPPLAETQNVPGEILVVEDEPIVREVACEMLRKNGFSVISCENGKQALEYAEKNNSVDVIILDMIMPELSGYDTYQKLIKIKDFKIIVATGYADNEETKKLSSLGVPIIQKPYTSQILISEIKKLLNS